MTADSLLIHDRRAWDAFIAPSRFGHILQSWEWGEIKAESGWQPWRLAIGAEERISAGAQILIRPLPYGVGRLAYVPRGPVLDYSDVDQVAAMVRALRRFAAEQRVIALKIEPEVIEPSPLSSELARLGLTPAPPVQMRSTIWVDLTASEEEMLTRQKQKTRYNIRLAERKGVTVTASGPAGIDDWYDLYEVTAHRDHFTIHGRAYYRRVLEVLQPHGMAELLLAHHEGDLLAGVIVFAFGRTAQYMYGASSNEKRNLMAPYLLQWRGMLWAKERGAEIYDLWGIPDRLEENEDLWGVYRHKRGYGGEIVRYVGAFDLIRSRARHLALERVARPLFKQVSRMGV